MKRKIIQVVLLLVIIVLAYFVYQSINTPLKFRAAKDLRADVVIQDLKDIRSGQLIFKKMHNEYAANFDTLLQFLREGQIIPWAILVSLTRSMEESCILFWTRFPISQCQE